MSALVISCRCVAKPHEHLARSSAANAELKAGFFQRGRRTITTSNACPALLRTTSSRARFRRKRLFVRDRREISPRSAVTSKS